MRKFLASLSIAVLLITSSAQAAFAAPFADNLPDDIPLLFSWTADGFFRDFIVSEVETNLSYDKEPLDATQTMLLNALKSGSTFHLGFKDESNLVIAFEAPQSAWDKAALEDEFTDTESKIAEYEYEGEKLYYHDGYVIVGLEEGFTETKNPIIKSIKDIATGKSTKTLGKDANYLKVMSDLKDSNSLSMFMNLKEVIKTLPKEEISDMVGPGANFDAIGEIMPLQGFGLNKNNDGYSLTYKVLADKAKADEFGIRLDIQNFIPSIHNQLSDNPILFYSAGSDMKAGLEQSRKFAITEEAGDTYEQLFALYYGLTGVHFEKLLEIDNEYAFAIQYDKTTLVPYITFIAKTSANSRSKLVELTKELTESAKKSLMQNDSLNINNSLDIKDMKDGQDYTKITVDISSLLKEEQEALPLETFELTFGVTSDDYFVLSNVPNIEKTSVRKGVTADSRFTDFMNEMKIESSLNGFAYLNLRRVWDYVDDFIESQPEVDLEFVQGYYAFLNEAYPWKELTFKSNSTQYETVFSGALVKDSKKHSSYKAYLDKLRDTDSDGDGYSDYLELVEYQTPVEIADSDGDGVSDAAEIKNGRDPNGDGRLFEDLEADTFYTRDVALLNRRGAISGYADKSFKPGNFITRAEYTTMIMKALQDYKFPDNSFHDDEDLKLMYGWRFQDVEGDEWYAPVLMQANAQGIVAGSKNEAGELIFRPNDQINRAEAIAILNKASKVLNKNLANVSCKGERAFIDVERDAWFCGAVTNAYNHGVTKGRGDGVFAPSGLLNRAEAAVMIQRALEGDIQMTTEESELGDLIDIGGFL